MENIEHIGENKIRKVLFNEVSLFIALVGVVSSVMFWVLNPQRDMQLQIVKMQTQLENTETVTAALDRIKANDLNEIQQRIDQIEARQIEELKAIARLEALLSR